MRSRPSQIFTQVAIGITVLLGCYVLGGLLLRVRKQTTPIQEQYEDTKPLP